MFRRVNGHLHLLALRAALEREFTELVGLVVHERSLMLTGPPPKFHGTRDSLSRVLASWTFDGWSS